MKIGDEELKRILREQRDVEENGSLSEEDMKAYSALMEVLDGEQRAYTQTATDPALVDAVMMQVLLLEEKKEEKRDAVFSLLAVLVGILALTVVYFATDYSALHVIFEGLQTHLFTLLFLVTVVVLVQVADRKLVWKK